MKKLSLYTLLVVSCSLALTGSAIRAGVQGNTFSARLRGFQQVPAILTDGIGTFAATLVDDSLSYTLSYSGLSTSVFAAHIHFAQRGVNGGIFAFLCGGGGKPDCPPAGGNVTGTITAADILAPSPDQGLAAGDFAGALRALRSGNTYVNVHSTRFPAGEIRGQIAAENQQNQQ